MAHIEEFLSVKEVAQMLRVSVATVWRYVHRETLPEPIRIDGRTWWLQGEILAAIEKKKIARQPLASADSKANTKKRSRVRLNQPLHSTGEAVR